MASTFSPSLRLELIGDGDQSGIWGQTTNNNLGALIEQAITGVATINMVDANYTLTNFNGVVDEARNVVITLEGSLSAQRNVIAPLTEKLYTIRNATTGGFAIQIIGPSGTGVVIPNGMTTTVYCDGTNFLAGMNGTPGNFTITGNATITGNLTVNGASNIIPTGTRMPFAQAAAPTGFTQVTDDTANNRMLRVVNSSGGGVGGSASPILMNVVPNHTHTFTTGGMSANNVHSHGVSDPGHNHCLSSDCRVFDLNNSQGPGNNRNGGFIGGQNVVPVQVSGSAATNISINAIDLNHTHSGTTNSNAGSNWEPRYIDMIICAKN
jgi:hypothetical protein